MKRPPTWICITGLTVGVLLLLLVAVLPYTGPLADDIGRCVKTRDLGLFAATWDQYQGWSGRWAASLLSGLLSKGYGISGWYPLVLASVAFVCAAALAALAQQVSEGTLRRRTCAALGLAFLALYWAGAPEPADSFSWLTGALENSLSISLGVLLVVWLTRVSRGSHPPFDQRTATTLAALAAFFVVALHELFGAMLLLVLGLGAWRAWGAARRDKAGDDPLAIARARAARWPWSTTTLAAAAGFLVVLLAPGNDVRIGKFHHPKELTLAWELFAEQAGQAARCWLVDPRLWATTVLLALAPSVARARPTWLSVTGRMRCLWWVLPPWLLALIAGFATPGWYIGRVMPGRTRNGLYYVFLLGWFLLVFVLACGRRHSLAPRLLGTCRIAAALLFALGTGLLTNVGGQLEVRADDRLPRFGHDLLHSNATRAINDLRHTLRPLTAAVAQRADRLARAAVEGRTMVILDPLPTAPQLVRTPEVKADPTSWINVAFAAYNGVAAVRGVDPDSGEYALGYGVRGRLRYLGPDGFSNGARTQLFRRMGPTALRLRPPPPRRLLGPVRVRLELDPDSWPLDGHWQVVARAGLAGQGLNHPIRLALTLRDPANAVLGSTETTLALEQGLRELRVDVPEAAALQSLELHASLPEGIVDNLTGLLVERIALRSLAEH